MAGPFFIVKTSQLLLDFIYWPSVFIYLPPPSPTISQSKLPGCQLNPVKIVMALSLPALPPLHPLMSDCKFACSSAINIITCYNNNKTGQIDDI